MACAQVIVDELLRNGVTDIVISPGQRSAPLAIAALQAEQRGEVQLHVRTDERVAGFLALGIAKTLQRPVALVCTSGSAVANLLPAIVEADAADVPLVVVSADRPTELHDVGANQTMAQRDIFGNQVRWAHELAPLSNLPQQLAYVRSCVSQGVTAAVDASAPGPVHLNVQLREPLVAPPAEDSAHMQARSAGLPWTVDARFVGVSAVSIGTVLGQLCWPAQPMAGLVIVGDLASAEPYASEAMMLAAELGWPLISEPSGNARSAPTAITHAAILAAIPEFRAQHTPQLVVTVGKVGLHRGINQLIEASQIHIAVDPRPARTPTDPLRTADAMVAAVPVADPEWHADDAWLRSWLAADDSAEQLIAHHCENVWGGTAVAREVWRGIPDDGMVFAAASWSVRMLDMVAEYREESPWVAGNRGLSGIDGLVATAWGSALAHQRPFSAMEQALEMLDAEEGDELPTLAGGHAVALLGDIAFGYDLTALNVPITEPRPQLTYVVIDNDGGGIFSQLEAGEILPQAAFDRVFGTPTPVDLAAAVAAFGVGVRTVHSLAELQDALATRYAIEADSVGVIVAQVPARSVEAAALRHLQQHIAEALKQQT